ncbi:hypothetical protein UlMin_026332 [Ulmus minor]
MYRSASWNRASEDYSLMQSSEASSKGMGGMRMSSSLEENELPVYDQITEMAKKEKARIKFAETAVHLIPLVLIICAFILWFLSSPETEVLGRKMDSIAARIEGLSLDGEIDNDSDGTQIGVIPIVDATDFDSPKRSHQNRKPSRNLKYI